MSTVRAVFLIGSDEVGITETTLDLSIDPDSVQVIGRDAESYKIILGCLEIEMPKEIAESIVREIIRTGSDREREVLQKFYKKWGGKVNANLLPQPIRAYMKLAENATKETSET